MPTIKEVEEASAAQVTFIRSFAAFLDTLKEVAFKSIWTRCVSQDSSSGHKFERTSPIVFKEPTILNYALQCCYCGKVILTELKVVKTEAFETKDMALKGENIN